jgi:flagellar biogenesis protein FliO
MLDLKKLPVGDDPQKMLKVILGLAAVFLVLWVFVLAQSNHYDTVPAGKSGLVNTDSLHLTVVPQVKKASTDQNSSLFLRSLPVLIILTCIIAGLWFWQKKSTTRDTDIFTIVGRQQIGVGQQIIVILINEEYWVLAVSGKEITLLQKYDKDGWKGPQANKPNQNKRFLNIFSDTQKKYAS